MSSSLGSKKHAVSSAETGATENFANDGPSSQHKRMRLEPEDINDDDDQKPSADPHRDLDLAFQRKAKALADLKAAQRDIAKARRDIRARGEAEFDSLLAVGNDSVSHILCYVDVKQLCQCERTCKAFRRLSGDGWKYLDKRTGQNNSTVAHSPKERCVRYVRASEYAQKMEPYANSHRWIEYSSICENTNVQYHSLPSDNNDICDQLKNEIWPDNDDNSCESSALCGFPNELATVDKSKTELFLRICNRSGEMMMEGFFPLRTLEGGLRNGERCLDLCSAHCPNWPEMESFLSRQLSDQDARKNMWDDLAGFRIVTLIALTKFNAPRLVASIDDFDNVEIEDDEYPDYGGYPKDDPWYPTISAKNPMKPHYFQTEEMKVKSRGVEFGWCKNRKVIGFCLVESEHVYHDF